MKRMLIVLAMLAGSVLIANPAFADAGPSDTSGDTVAPASDAPTPPNPPAPSDPPPAESPAPEVAPSPPPPPPPAEPAEATAPAATPDPGGPSGPVTTKEDSAAVSAPTTNGASTAQAPRTSAAAAAAAAAKVTLCHATGSPSNPYVPITISPAGAFNGHLGHQGGADIVPPFSYQGQTYSQNWDPAGQAIFNAGCAQGTLPPPPPPPASNVSLCHATGSVTNPYELITISPAGAFNGHLGQHDGADIIPPFVYQANTYSQNWGAEGQAIFNAGCTQGTLPPPPPATGNVLLCHATGSATDPYVQITIDPAGAFNGHLGHQGGADIIPPFTYQANTYQQHWDAAGQAVFNNGCVVPAQVLATPGSQQSGTHTHPAGGTGTGTVVSAAPALSSQSASVLPNTGGPSLTLVLVGGLLMGAGGLLVLLCRPSRRAPASRVDGQLDAQSDQPGAVGASRPVGLDNAVDGASTSTSPSASPTPRRARTAPLPLAVVIARGALLLSGSLTVRRRPG